MHSANIFKAMRLVVYFQIPLMCIVSLHLWFRLLALWRWQWYWFYQTDELMEHGLYWEAYSYSASQIPAFRETCNVHYHVHKTPSLVHSLILMKSVCALLSYSFSMCFNCLAFTFRSCKQPLHVFLLKVCMHLSCHPCVQHALKWSWKVVASKHLIASYISE